MKLLVALACVLVGCLAQQPHPCKSPPLLTGRLAVHNQDNDVFAFGAYIYDAIEERIRLAELVSVDNSTFTTDVLLLFREQALYNISEKDKTCSKLPLKSTFVPIAVPGDATFVAQAVLGDSSYPGEGLLVSTWHGNVPEQGKLVLTVTEFGCVPVTYAQQTKQYGWVYTTYFDNVVGITNPDLLIPPSFCPGGDSPPNGEPVDLISFLKQRK